MSLLREDYATNHMAPLRWTVFVPGFQAMLAYRLGSWCNGLSPWILRAPVRLVQNFLSYIVRNVYGIELYSTARIGRRFCIAHQHGIVIHKFAMIGDDCVVRQGVTIGGGGIRNDATGAPRLGDRVKVGAGAVIAGSISIGDDVVIGPNAVAMSNVPAGSIVTAPPSRIMTPPPRRAIPAEPTRSGAAEAAAVADGTQP